MRSFRALQLVLVLALSVAMIGCGGSEDESSGSDESSDSTTEETTSSAAARSDLTDVDGCELLTDDEISDALGATVNDGPTTPPNSTQCAWGLGVSPASYIAEGETDGSIPPEHTDPGNGQLRVGAMEQPADFEPDAFVTGQDGWTIVESDTVEGLYFQLPDAEEVDGVVQVASSLLLRRGVAVYLDLSGGVVPGTGNGGPKCSIEVVEGCDPEGAVTLPDGPGTEQLEALYTAIAATLDQM